MTKISSSLSPSESANVASLVYDLKSALDIEQSFEDSLVDKHFNFASNTNRFDGRSGAHQ